jgi:hypothetical protein
MISVFLAITWGLFAFAEERPCPTLRDVITAPEHANIRRALRGSPIENELLDLAQRGQLTYWMTSRNAHLFLFTPPTGEIRVIKVYAEERHQRLDIAHWEMLRSAQNPVSAGSLHFRIPSIQNLGDIRPFGPSRLNAVGITMPLYPGRTLHSILIDSSISETRKQELRRAFQARIESLRQGHELGCSGCDTPYTLHSDRAFFTDERLDGSEIWFFPEEGRSQNGERVTPPYGAMIKTDNIIVDPETDEMTLIDPY